jgi:hypothetical protein
MNRLLKIAGIVLAVVTIAGAATYAYTASRGETKMLGVVVAAKNAAFDVRDQPGVFTTIAVGPVLAPGPSWVVVHLDMDGKPGPRVGLAHVDAGETRTVTVVLDPKIELTEKLLVALHADRGVTGAFEFDMDKFEASPDKPYFVDGMELAKAVRVR